MSSPLKRSSPRKSNMTFKNTNQNANQNQSSTIAGRSSLSALSEVNKRFPPTNTNTRQQDQESTSTLASSIYPDTSKLNSKRSKSLGANEWIERNGGSGEGESKSKSIAKDNTTNTFVLTSSKDKAGPRKSAFRTAPPQVFKEPEEDDSNSPNHSDSTRKSRRLSDRATDVISSLGSTIGGFLGSNRSSNDSQSTSGSGSNNTISILPSARGQGERSLPPGIKRSLSEGQLEDLQEEEGEGNKEKERELVKRPRKSVAFKQKNRETRFDKEEPTEVIRRASLASTSASTTSNHSFSLNDSIGKESKTKDSEKDGVEDGEDSDDDDDDMDISEGESEEEREMNKEIEASKSLIISNQSRGDISVRSRGPRDSLAGIRGNTSVSKDVEIGDEDETLEDEEEDEDDEVRRRNVDDGDRTQTMQITQVYGGMLNDDEEDETRSDEESGDRDEEMDMDMDITENVTGGIQDQDQGSDDEEDEEEVERSILLDGEGESEMEMDFTVALGGIEKDDPNSSPNKKLNETSNPNPNSALSSSRNSTKIPNAGPGGSSRKSLPASKINNNSNQKTSRASISGPMQSSTSTLKRKATEDLSASSSNKVPTKPLSSATEARRARASMPSSRGGPSSSISTSTRGGKAGRASVGSVPNRGGNVGLRGRGGSTTSSSSATNPDSSSNVGIEKNQMGSDDASSFMEESMVDQSGMEMTQALGGILEDDDDEEEGSEMSMSRSRNVDGTLNMEMTTALGGILQEDPSVKIPSSHKSNTEDARVSSPIRKGHEHCSKNPEDSPILKEKKRLNELRNSPQFVSKTTTSILKSPSRSPVGSPVRNANVSSTSGLRNGSSPSKTTSSTSSPNRSKNLALGNRKDPVVVMKARTSLPARRVIVNEDPRISPSKKQAQDQSQASSSSELEIPSTTTGQSFGAGRMSMPAKIVEKQPLAMMGPSGLKKARQSLSSSIGSNTSSSSSSAPVSGSNGGKVRRRSSLLASAVPNKSSNSSREVDDEPMVDGKAKEEATPQSSENIENDSSNENPNEKSMELDEIQEQEEEEVIEEPQRRLKLEEFLPIVGIEFHDSSDFKASKRQVFPPQSSSDSKGKGKGKSRSSTSQEAESSKKSEWEKQFKLAMMEAGESILLKNLEDSCLALENDIKTSSELLNQQEREFYLNPPDFVNEILELDSLERKDMESVFNLQKQFARTNSIKDYYDWRSENEFNDEILNQLKENLEKLRKDEKLIKENGRTLRDSLLPFLKNRERELEKELEIEQKRNQEIQDGKEDLEGMMEAVEEQGQHLSSQRGLYLQEEKHLLNVESRLSEINSQKSNTIGSISKSKETFERIQGCTKDEVSRLRSEILDLERLLLTRLTSIDKDRIELIHDEVLQVRLDLQRGGMVEKVKIDFVDESLKENVVYKFSLNALVKGVEKELEIGGGNVSPTRILRIVSSTWTCAHQLQYEIDRLSSHYPISKSISTDSDSLIVETSLLLEKNKSKCRVRAICDRESLVSLVGSDGRKGKGKAKENQDQGHVKVGVASFEPGKVSVELVYGKVDSLAMAALITDCLADAPAMGSLTNACVQAVETFDV